MLNTKYLTNIFLTIFVFLGSHGISAAASSEQMASPKLMKQMAMFKPSIQAVGKRVHAVFGYEYSNYAYIEGDDGIIVIDAGWYTGQAKRSIKDFRDTVSDKPIVAIIYTHLHTDHFGGASAIMEGQESDIPVYGPKGWERWVNESFSHMGPAIHRRGFMQMGLVLPRGENGSVGNGIGPSPRLEGDATLSFPPTISVDQPLELTISGVKIKLIPQQGDMPENLYIWLPDEEILFVGDIPLHTTFPALETVRFEIERDPRALVGSLTKLLDLDPKFILPGHGRILRGRKDVRDVAEANLDIVEFMIDQLDRYYLNGYSADQIVDRLKLPPKLAAHPDLQPFYHRLEWMIKTMYVKRAGFVGETMDYLTHTQSQESKRLVPLLGGPASVLEMAKQALNADDPRWAARLATYLLDIDDQNLAAKELRQTAFIRVARTTESGNERNYLLSSIREENGEIDWKMLFSKSIYEGASEQSLDTVLSFMKSRFRAEDADGEELLIRITVSDESPRYLKVRNNVLRVSHIEDRKIDGAMTLSRDTLNKITANMMSWSDALSGGDITAEQQGSKHVERLLALIE